MKTLQIARVWMMMVDALVLDLSFKACKYGGALLVSHHTHICIFVPPSCPIVKKHFVVEGGSFSY